jgi:Na+-translocating ferredoxin:NAD+ oxidoreductase RnfC subunit
MELIDKIAAAGIVGCGGAGFPTDRKLKLKEPPEYFIMNGAECEPLLRTDRYLMTNFAGRIVKTLMRIKHDLQAAHCVIAVKANYTRELASLRKAIGEENASIEIHELDSFYPAGDEQTIVYEVTGRVVPPGGLPSMVGAVVDNVGTVLAIADALEDKPFIYKYLTVTGEVRHPAVLRVPIGTSFAECLRQAGGTAESNFFAISGGPMMGKPVPMENFDSSVVTKTTSSILILPSDGRHARAYAMDVRHMLNQARSACIQCSFCTQLCPRNLLGHPLQPHKIMRKLSLGTPLEELLEDTDIRNAALCCECGVCEIYACPMGLRPRTINSMLKKELSKAGIRYACDPQKICTPSKEREERKAPTGRIAARAGVYAYRNLVISELLDVHPDKVSIPLKMGIGVASNPTVTSGEAVREGQIIAVPAEYALGSVIHASISGVAEVREDCIVITENEV